MQQSLTNNKYYKSDLSQHDRIRARIRYPNFDQDAHNFYPLKDTWQISWI